MIKIILINMAFIYSLIAAHFFRVWLEFIKQDISLSAKDKRLSLEILAIATLFWPIVVPISYLELLKTRKMQE
jgi:hypothetical protein